MPVSVFPRGTTIYRPDKCFNGYTLILLDGADGPWVGLIDMNGRTTHRWQMASGSEGGYVPRARLLPDGRLLVLRARGSFGCGRAEEYAWEGEPVWEYEPPEGLFAHHDIEKTAEGNTLLICREEVPESIRNEARQPERREKLYADVIQEISPRKEGCKIIN